MGEDVLCQLFRTWEAFPSARQPFSGTWLVVFGGIGSVLKHPLHPFAVLVDILLREGTLLDQSFSVLGQRSGLLLNGLVHFGLSEAGLVRLVMAVATVADDVDNNILLPLSAPIGRELANEGDSFGIISVNVEDWGVDGFGNVGWVGRGPGESWVGRESDLVVNDKVDGSSNAVVGEIVHAGGFVHDTLAGEGSVTVQENRHRMVVGLLVTVEVLDSSNLSNDDRVLGFQV